MLVFVVNQTLQHELCTSVDDSPQTNPIIARIARKAGHGCGQPTQKMVSSTLKPTCSILLQSSCCWSLVSKAITISDTK